MKRPKPKLQPKGEEVLVWFDAIDVEEAEEAVNYVKEYKTDNVPPHLGTPIKSGIHYEVEHRYTFMGHKYLGTYFLLAKSVAMEFRMRFANSDVLIN